MENVIDSISPICTKIVQWGKSEIPFPTYDVGESLLRWAGSKNAGHRWIHAQQILVYSIYGLSKEKVGEAAEILKQISFKVIV